MLLPDGWRNLKLLRDDPTEHLQRSLTILWAKKFPEAMQGYPPAGPRFWRKKVPSWLSRMTFLLEYGDWRRTNRRASKKRRQTIPGSWARVQSGSVCASYVYAFWGEERELHRFLQTYAVEVVRMQARQRGMAVTEQQLPDGSIKLQIQEG